MQILSIFKNNTEYTLRNTCIMILFTYLENEQIIAHISTNIYFRGCAP